MSLAGSRTCIHQEREDKNKREEEAKLRSYE